MDKVTTKHYRYLKTVHARSGFKHNNDIALPTAVFLKIAEN